MAYEAGTAFLQIVPSFQGVVEKISDQAAQWGETAGKAFTETFEEATKGISLGPSDEDSSRQGSSSGGAFADGFRAKVEAALKALPDANVNLDDAEAEAKLDDLRARLETLRDVVIGVDVSDAEALAAVEIIKGELDELGAKSPSIRVQVDTAEASAELGALDAEADASGGGLLSLGGDAESGGAGIGSLIGALAVLATALIPIGGLAAGALSALPSLLAGAASGLGALKLGFSGISGALSAYTSQQKGAGAATASTGQSATSAAEQALSAAQEEQSAAQAVANAQEALGNAQTEAADSVHRAQEQLTQSTQALAAAEQAEQNAQVALTQARIDAANAIVNLNDQVADGALAIQQATLDQATAQTALATAQQTPGTSAGALAQAQLTAAQASQHLQDLTDQQQQLTQAQTASNAAGVAGAAGVVSATQALGAAQQTVATDQQSQTDASNALLEAQATAVQKVSDAQTSLATAISSQSATLQRVALEAQAAGASAGGAAAPTNAFAAAMAGLTPAGRTFVTFLTSTLLPMYDAFKAQVQEALLPGITVALAGLLPVFQTIEPFIIQAALGISSFAQNLSGLLSSGPGLFNLSTIFEAGAGFMQDLAKAVLIAVPAFLTIGAQASPIVGALGKGIKDLVGAFANWVANGGFEKFLTWLKTNGPGIVSDLSRLLTGIGHLTISLAPLGGIVLKIVGYLVTWIAAIAKFDPLLTIVIGLVVLFAAVIAPVIAAIAAVSFTVGIVIAVIAALVVGITLLVTHWTTVWSAVQGAVDGAWLDLDGIFQAIANFFTVTIPGALDTVGQAFSVAWSAIQGAVGAAWSWIVTNVLDPIGQYFTVSVPGAIGQLLGVFASIPGQIGASLSSVFGTITGAFGDVGSWVTTNIINPVVGFFEALPGNIASAMSAGATAAGSALSSIGKDVVNGIIGALNHIIDTIDDALAGVSAFGFHPFGTKTIPDIPTLHTGGIVPGAAGADVPTILQAGELVLSRSDVANLRATPGAGSGNGKSLYQEINVTAYDPRTAAIETQQKSDFAAKTRGF